MWHHFRRRSGWILVSLLVLLPTRGLAEVGPAVTGFTGRANDALAVFWSPAALTRLDKPELVAQGMLVYSEAKFEVDSATFDGGTADNDNRLLAIPGIYYAHPLGERWRLGVSLSEPGTYRGLRLGALQPRGEVRVLTAPLSQLMRLRHNLFFGYVQQRVVALANRVSGNSQVDEPQTLGP